MTARQPPTAFGSRTLLQTGAAAIAVTFVLAAAGAVSAGSQAAYGALIGGLLAVVVFLSSAAVVSYVARAMPAASLIVALLTYTLQVAVMAVVFLALHRSGWLETALDRYWLAGAVITVTLVWTMVQITLASRVRIPTYQLESAEQSRSPEAGAR